MAELPFVDILLPVPIARRYTYRVPAEKMPEIARGKRVAVPFGKRRILTGIVDQTGVPAPEKYEAKYILDVLDTAPVVTDIQFRLIDWMAGYYMCPPGDVVQAMLPAGMKISTTSYVQLHPDRPDDYSTSDPVQRLVDALEENDTLQYEDAKEILSVSNPFTIIQHLVRDGVLLVFDQVKERYTPKTERYVRLSETIKSNPDDLLKQAFDKLSRAPKQEDALLIFLQMISDADGTGSYDKHVARKQLSSQGVSDSTLKSLADKGILELFDMRVGRFAEIQATRDGIMLSPAQEKAKNDILSSLESKDVTLLHGVTGSGKTEIYMQLISEVISQGEQVLYLLPEIALTTQIVNRLRIFFGDRLGVYHSKFSDNERVEVWQGILKGRYQIIVGVRSSVFLPFDSLGLIIVDEEHEHSYKQHDPSPRYHARDTALMLARFHHAKVVLGTATPSLETFFLAQKGTYGLVSLNERFGKAVMPQIETVNLQQEKRRKKMKGSLSEFLIAAMRETLDNEQQVILFQNRRGYSPCLRCDHCGYIPQCMQCSVSLTYHQFGQALICHYCGSREPVPHTCEACGSHAFNAVGLGTEKLEEEVALEFPGTRIQRMDLDTTRSKFSYERILQDFAEKQMEVLVGTQMVAKGLDFGNVGLVGIADLDSLMNYPDFRSYEKAFQLGVQVSGRAGRGDKKGKVIIQTHNPEHHVVEYIRTANLDAFYTSELKERKQYFYPPYSRLVKIILKHRDKQVVHEATVQLAEELKKMLSHRVLGPQEPVINRIRNEYIMEILIKLERTHPDREKIKQRIYTLSEILRNQRIFRNLKVAYNVDPY